MFLDALREYGAYLVDNAGGFTFYAEDIATAPVNLTSDEINLLIGRPIGTPLPVGKTKWQVVIEPGPRESPDCVRSLESGRRSSASIGRGESSTTLQILP